MSGTIDHLFSASCVIAAGALVESILGFGCNLVWMAAFPLFTTVKESVAVHQPLGMGLNLLILARTYQHATPADLKPLMLTVPMGVAVGLWVVTSWPVRAINGLLGAFLLVYTFLNRNGNEGGDSASSNAIKGDDSASGLNMKTEETEEARPSSTTESEASTFSDIETQPLKKSPPTTEGSIFFRQSPISIAAGFLGGALTSAFGTGGPAILIYARECGWDAKNPDGFRANMQLVFFSMHILAISSMVAGKVITMGTVIASAMLSPSLILGGFLGGKVAARVPKKTFSRLVLVGLRVIGVLFITKALQ